jgi:hypothetical protein
MNGDPVEQEAQSSVVINGVNMDDALAAYRQHPELSSWMRVSHAVIRDYVETNATLGQQLREAAEKEAGLERHIETLEESNAALLRELEPEAEPE